MGLVSLAVFGSRICGLIREQVFAAMFGAGKHLDAFLGAFQIPNLMRDLFAEGALSTAFTTVFSKTHEKEGAARAWGLASVVISTVIVLIGAVCLAGILVSPLLVEITNFGFHSVPGKYEITVKLTRVLFPFILLVSLAAVVMGILNAHFIFGLPASASTAFNIVSVIAGVALAFAVEQPADWRKHPFGERALFGVAVGVLLGGVAQVAIQLPALWRLGYRFRWRLDFADTRLREVWRLMGPSVIAGAAVQVNVVINGMFASEIDGARSWLNCAFRLMQFPIGLFGVAIATVTLPTVSRHHARGDLAAFGRTVEQGLRLAFFLTIPAAVGLAVLAPEIIGLIYEHGHFSFADTLRTAAALRAYAVGLAGYAAIKVLVPCFYALNEPTIPLRVSLLAIAVNLGLNLVFVKALGMGHVGLATTTGILAVINFVQLAVYLRRWVKFGRSAEWRALGTAICLAAVVCALGAFVAAETVERAVGTGLKARLAGLGAGVTTGAVLYILVAFFLNVREARDAVTFVVNRTRQHLRGQKSK